MVRNGTLLAGFTGSIYTLGTIDEGTTLTCVVTASNAAGQASATSNAVKIPIPVVPHCPGATGSMTGTTIGQITLGMTQVVAALPGTPRPPFGDPQPELPLELRRGALRTNLATAPGRFRATSAGTSNIAPA